MDFGRRETWDEILTAKDAYDRLEELHADGTLHSVFPEITPIVGFGGLDEGHKDLWDHTKRVVSQAVPQPVVRWAALFHDVGKPKRFHRDPKTGKISFHNHEGLSASLFRAAARRTQFFTSDEAKTIEFLIRHLGHVEAYERDWTDSAVRRLSKLIEGYTDEVLALCRADITTRFSEKRRAHIERTNDLARRIRELAALDAIPPALPKGLGDALMAKLGLQPGRELGLIMNGLRGRVEAGELPRNAEIEVYLQALVTRQQ